jgi:ATP-binding cassette subfamily C protein
MTAESGPSSSGTAAVYRYFFTAYPARTALMIALMFAAGLAEGIGVVTLVPVLGSLDPGGSSNDAVTIIVHRILGSVGLEPSLATLLGLIVIAMTAKAIALAWSGRQVGYTVAGVVRDLRLELIRALLGARWSYFVRHRAGEFANTIASEAMRSSMAYRGACHIVALVLQMGAYLLVAALIAWPIAIAALALGVVLTLFARRLFSMSRVAGVQQTRAASELTARLVDVLQGIKSIKAMRRERLVWPLLEHETERLNRAQRSEVNAASMLKALQEPILTVVLAIGIYIAIPVYGQSLSEVLVLAFLFYRLVGQINQLQMQFQILAVGESAFAAFKARTDEALAQEETLRGSRIFSKLTKGVTFENVEFGYGDHRVIDGLNLHIPAGEFVAVSGGSGVGKTTLADLLVGLHAPTSGRILVDGVPLQEWELTSWRGSLGYVPQDTLLFSDSVLMNVTLGDPALTREDARRALEKAGAWAFVEARPGGLDSHIGSTGSMLSGGQRQRIAIARALVGGPSILILDEVTSALDPETERGICQTLEGLAGDVTIFSISHQAALRDVATRAYDLKSGRVQPVAPSVVG